MAKLSHPGAARLASKKRKLSSTSTSTSATVSTSRPTSVPKPIVAKTSKQASKLSWKNIVLPSEFGFDEDGGLLGLDEVEGVDVVYNDDGRVSFRVKEDEEEGEEPTKKKQKKSIPTPTPTITKPDKEELKALKADGWLMEDDIEEDEGEKEGEKKIEEEEKKKAEEEEAVQEKEAAPSPEPPKSKKGKAKGTLAPPVPTLPTAEKEEDFEVKASLPQWAHLSLPTPLFRALHELGFTKPTLIQERALSVEIGSKPYVEPEVVEKEEEEEWGGIVSAEEEAEAKKIAETKAQEVPQVFKSVFVDEDLSPKPNLLPRDIVGVAQTGSGKTFAYGLPILSYILSTPVPLPSSTTPHLAALILTPTRELALQVRASLSALSQRINKLLPEELQDPNKNAPRKRVNGRWISVVALTGGMSVEKQKRQLSRGGGADILVATPGRLWELIGEDDNLARAIKGIKFLVVDEADRMIENGHFAELENIVRLTRRKPLKTEEDFNHEDDFRTPLSNASKVDLIEPREDMRTFVFSATMSKDLQRNLKKQKFGGASRAKIGKPEDGMSSLDDLLLKLDFRDPDPEVIDLSPEGGLVETLKECKTECLFNEKDAHLYHFLLRYPGRTIVFLGSIDGIRRLHPLLTLLGLNVIPLHSGMQQRARLKSLDRFKSSPTAILLATDVAARGLDIPSVSHVVHYQLPRSADVYVHRSGRTARAGQEGLALQLCAPDEKQTQRLLMASLGKDVDLPTLPVDYSILDKLKERIELAKKIDSGMHKATKEAHDDNWLKQAAEAMDIDIDSDLDLSDGENSGLKSRKKAKGQAAKVKNLKSQLQALLDKPLMMRGVSTKYLTTRGRVGFVDQLMDGTNHSAILGFDNSTALEDLPKPKKKPVP